jgi:hypothetical protein
MSIFHEIIPLGVQKTSLLISIDEQRQHLTSNERNELKERHLRHHLDSIGQNVTNFKYDPFYNFVDLSQYQVSISHTKNVVISLLCIKSKTHFWGIDIEQHNRSVSAAVEKWMQKNLDASLVDLQAPAIQRWCQYEALYKAAKKAEEFLPIPLTIEHAVKEHYSINWKGFIIEAVKISSKMKLT